jgi:predicted CoA-binding protein
MATKADVDDFLAQKTLAVAGVSRKRMKFGSTAYRELKGKGYRVFPINPKAETIEGETCYPNVGALPEEVDGLLIVLPPSQTEKVVREAADAGIPRVWIQQGSQSDEAIRLCKENGMSVVDGECILMFAEPVGFLHRVHRWVWGLLGKLPK